MPELSQILASCFEKKTLVEIHHDLQRHGINQFIAFKRDGKEPYAYESKVAENSSARYSDQHGCTKRATGW